MKLSPAAEFAVRGVLVVAQRAGPGPVSLETICAERDLAPQYLAKIFATLVRADLVTAFRGKHGGYRLAREPQQISILEVIEAIEGPMVLNLCQHDPPRCEETDCPLRPVWSELQEVVREKLGSITLQDCLDRGKTPPTP
jgi:Rrf2 family protein